MKLNPDKLLTYMAILVSAATLFIIVYQTSLIRKQQYATVLPYLEIGNSDAGNAYRFLMVNNGVGPAFVESVEMVYQDKVYEGDPFNFFMEVISKEDSLDFVYSNIYEGQLIPAGKRIELIYAEGEQNMKKARNWFGGSRVTMKIRYKSVYDQRWEVTSKAPPKSLN